MPSAVPPNLPLTLPPQLKQLLAETEKLSAEVLGLRGRSARLQLQLEVGTAPVSHRVTLCNLLSLWVTGVTLCPRPACNARSSRSSTATPWPCTGATSSRLPRWDPPALPGVSGGWGQPGGIPGNATLPPPQGFMDEGVHAALLRILRAEAGAGPWH